MIASQPSLSGAARALPKPTRFVTIDALRGVAAITIVLYHYSVPSFHLTESVSSLYLAVDLFFMLSGFVIALSYENKLNDGMGIIEFFWHRMVRLYPLAFLGMLIAGSALLAGALASHADHTRLVAMARDAFKGLVFLPRLHGDDFTFPTNPPMWSLMFEVAVNLLYALTVPLLTMRRLVVVCVSAAIGVVVSAYAYGNLDMGASTHSFPGGTFRTLWGFSMGVVLYRIWRRGDIARLPNVAPAPLAFGYLLCCATPYHASYSWVLDVAAVLVAFPVLVALAIRSTPAPAAARWCEGLGLLSYPLYVLHWGVMLWALIVVPKIAELRVLVVAFLVVIGLSYLAALYWDEPVRALMRPLTKRWFPARVQSALMSPLP